MTAIILDRFGGAAPRYDAWALPPHGAQIARGTRMHAGVLKGFRRAAPLYPPVSAPGAQTIFYDVGGGNWFTWSADVNVVLGPVADSTVARRYYYTGDGPPKKTDSTMAASGSGAYPQASLNMGVPAPVGAPTVGQTGGSGGTEDHVYVITYVSEFSGIEEESAPSAPVTMAGRLVGTMSTVTLTWTDTVPTSGYNITKRRVYRSNGSDYLFVGEYSIATYPTSATEAVANAALGEAISTIYFDPPPADLKSLVALPNGSLAGISGNELCFSEPFQPHAWPTLYRIPVTDIPVALLVIGQSLYVATEGRPALCTGVHPDSMSLEYSPAIAPCLAPRTFASDGKGAMYASYNGVVYVSGISTETMSEDFMTLEEWSTYAPESMIGRYYNGRYTLWYDNGTDRGSLNFDRLVQDAPLSMGTDTATAAHVEPSNGKLYVLDEGEVREANADLISPRVPFLWRSKLFILPRAVNFRYARVISDESLSDAAEEYAAKLADNEATVAAGGGSGAWADVNVNEFPVNSSELHDGFSAEVPTEYVTLRVYAEGRLIITKNISSDEAFKLPSGFKEKRWEIEVTGTRPVRQVALATELRELQS